MPLESPDAVEHEPVLPVRCRPILFSGPMVRAILGGHKTMTRRVVKPQPEVGSYSAIDHEGVPWWCWDDGRGRNAVSYYWEDGKEHAIPAYRCPFGVPGDRLWVRETWAGDDLCGVVYRTDHPDAVLKFGDLDDGEQSLRCWRPSIHMPRWASRITLEVTDVRVERLQDMDHCDAEAEGIRGTSFRVFDDGPLAVILARDVFATLWDSLNAKRGYGWAFNPWVWVVEFRGLSDA